MDLSLVGLTGKKQEILNRDGIYTIEDLLCTRPRKYYYFDTPAALQLTPGLQNLIDEKEPVAIIGRCISVENDYNSEKKMSLIKIKVIDSRTDTKLHINIIGGYNMLNYYKYCEDKDVIVGGKLNYSEEYHSFSMLNPVVFSTKIKEHKKIIPVYRKYKGISEEFYYGCVDKGLSMIGEDYLPENFVYGYKLLKMSDTLRIIHHPVTKVSISQAEKRLIFDDMLYFACKIEDNRRKTVSRSDYTIKDRKAVDKLIKSLPFSPTGGQADAINGLMTNLINGRRINALVQGDVGTGKTIVAFSALVAIASDGYQGVLMAPTTVLAKQHFDSFAPYADLLGINAVYLSNALTAKEKRAVIKKIESGEAKVIIGTHSCISSSVKYHNLALTITDEEHKFGVMQRDALSEMTGDGLHVITMSGTPIPRTVASSLYGDSIQIYNLERPAERKPIITRCMGADRDVLTLLNRELKAGHQAYVVCPLINEGAKETVMEGVSSVEEVFDNYSRYYSKYNVKVECITGKTSKEEQEEIMQRFNSGETKILVATTVIEVGVNNPNATVMVITGAERFGSASLHQLRGRVGRGSAQSYCILQTSKGFPPSENMRIVESTNDGYQISVADMQNRGAGNILGEEQSGNNKYIELVYAFPKLFEKCKEIARWFYDRRECSHFVREYEAGHCTQN